LRGDFVGILKDFTGISWDNQGRFLALFGEKGKNKREKGKVSVDFRRFHRDFIGISWG